MLHQMYYDRLGRYLSLRTAGYDDTDSLLCDCVVCIYRSFSGVYSCSKGACGEGMPRMYIHLSLEGRAAPEMADHSET